MRSKVNVCHTAVLGLQGCQVPFNGTECPVPLLARCPEIPRMLIGMAVLVTQKPASPHSAKRAKPRHQDRAMPLRWEDRSQQESLKAMCPSRQPSGSSPVIQRCSSSHARLAQTLDMTSACMQCFLSSEKPFTEAIFSCAAVVMFLTGSLEFLSYRSECATSQILLLILGIPIHT